MDQTDRESLTLTGIVPENVDESVANRITMPLENWLAAEHRNKALMDVLAATREVLAEREYSIHLWRDAALAGLLTSLLALAAVVIVGAR